MTEPIDFGIQWARGNKLVLKFTTMCFLPLSIFVSLSPGIGFKIFS